MYSLMHSNISLDIYIYINIAEIMYIITTNNHKYDMLRTLPKIINDNPYDIYNLRPRKPLILRTPDAHCCFFSQIPGTDFL